MNLVAILYFSDRGAQMAARIASGLRETHEVQLHSPKGGLKALVQQLFSQVEALVFVGACGIAVRAVAPFLVSKTSDPAVIVADDRGRHVISLLSGHIGGANDLARRIAGRIGGEAVITTATDVNDRFSADAWAAKNGLVIRSMEEAKRFSAEILRRDLPFVSEFPIVGKMPTGLFSGAQGDCGMAISCRQVQPFDMTLLLIPRKLHIGVGCKRGTSAEKIRAAVQRALSEAEMCPQAVCAAASIDVKRDEEGLAAYCAQESIPLSFHTAQELRAVEGSFSSSEYVLKTVGVDNVCERAAVRSAGEGARLILKKTILDGVTVAIAQEKWSVSFE